MKINEFIDYLHLQNKLPKLKLYKEGVRCHDFLGVFYAKLKYHFDDH
jgi:hypothetical protein